MGLDACRAAAALLAVTVITIGRFGASPPGPLADDLLDREVVAGHVRSLMASHLTDVPSSDQHREGFGPVGGRLDDMAGRPVAALVYQRRLHVINLMVWPAPEQPDRYLAVAPKQGCHILHWTQGGMSFWSISDLNESEMKVFVMLLQR